MSVSFQIDHQDPTPIHAQLERAIRFAIATERLRAGDQLPTVRQLAVDLRINANTVARVYAELERDRVVETRRGVGTFVRARRFEAATRRDRERRLRQAADRFLAEVGLLGFSLDEVIAHLASRRDKGELP
jgi:GntR family transcriptional regulator